MEQVKITGAYTFEIAASAPEGLLAMTTHVFQDYFPVITNQGEWGEAISVQMRKPWSRSPEVPAEIQPIQHESDKKAKNKKSI